MTESTSARMPSLVDLQGKPTSDDVTWEAVLVNRAGDSNLLKLEQEAMKMAANSGKDFEVVLNSNLVRKLAIMVADYMGGSVKDPESMSRAWKSLSYSLKATLGSMVLPLGSLTIGLARHRALLFKVLFPIFFFLVYISMKNGLALIMVRFNINNIISMSR